MWYIVGRQPFSLKTSFHLIPPPPLFPGFPPKAQSAGHFATSIREKVVVLYRRAEIRSLLDARKCPTSCEYVARF